MELHSGQMVGFTIHRRIFILKYLIMVCLSKNGFLTKWNWKNKKTFYNDPEEMQGYFSQIIYIRTGNDEDFKLKLMMRGKTEFYSFYPKFWAILKSLNFRSNFF
jgi:hypothetical protein